MMIVIMISLHIPVPCETGSCPIVHVVYMEGVCSKYKVFITVWGKVASGFWFLGISKKKKGEVGSFRVTMYEVKRAY